MVDLYPVALSFRQAFEKAINCGEISGRGMPAFPRGWCTTVNRLFQKYLFEQEIETQLVFGSYGYGERAESHSWLETENEIVIDITGDQFANKRPCFTESVYVGTRDNSFHDQFEVTELELYQVTRSPFCKTRLEMVFDDRYKAIIRRIKNEHYC